MSRRPPHLLRLSSQASGLAIAAALGWTPARALPTGGVFTRDPAGNGAITATSSATTTVTVNSSTNPVTGGKFVVDWTSFDIGSGQQVVFTSASPKPALDVVLNRVSSSGLTTIAGGINGNTGVWLFTPGGVTFASGSIVALPVFGVSTGMLTDTDRSALVV